MAEQTMLERLRHIEKAAAAQLLRCGEINYDLCVWLPGGKHVHACADGLLDSDMDICASFASAALQTCGRFGSDLEGVSLLARLSMVKIDEGGEPDFDSGSEALTIIAYDLRRGIDKPQPAIVTYEIIRHGATADLVNRMEIAEAEKAEFAPLDSFIKGVKFYSVMHEAM